LEDGDGSEGEDPYKDEAERKVDCPTESVVGTGKHAVEEEK
jgi:hypothetical protein